MYESFYKLSARPFQLSPDPRFFYASTGHKRALAYLRYGIKQGEGFIIVTGNVGTGKSMLIGALFQSLARENVVAAQVVTTQVQADDLYRLHHFRSYVASGEITIYKIESENQIADYLTSLSMKPACPACASK